MKLIELLSILQKTADENNLSKPYVVGGLPRDLLLKKIDKIKDIDITCGDETSIELSNKLVKKIPGSTVTLFNDGHSRFSFSNFNMDFSNNFRVSDVEEIVGKKLTELEKELYSRDFFINTLLMPMDLSTVLDLTGSGIEQVRGKIIDTVLDPSITLKVDPKRIVRVIYLASKLNFTIADRVTNWIVSNPDISTVPKMFIKQKINKAFKYNPDLTMELLKKLNLLNKIPETLLFQSNLVGSK